MKNIKVYRQVNEQDKIVFRALEITKNFMVLPYNEVEKRLDKKINYALLNQKYNRKNGHKY